MRSGLQAAWHGRPQAIVAWALAAAITGGAIGCSGIEHAAVWTMQSAPVCELGTTFAWAPTHYAYTNDECLFSPRFRQMLAVMVEDGFIQKCYEKSESPTAGFWIGYRVLSETRGSPYDGATAFTEHTNMTLIVYVIDPETKETLWVGWARTSLKKSRPPENKRERIEKMICKILKRFPSCGRPLRRGER